MPGASTRSTGTTAGGLIHIGAGTVRERAGGGAGDPPSAPPRARPLKYSRWRAVALGSVALLPWSLPEVSPMLPAADRRIEDMLERERIANRKKHWVRLVTACNYPIRDDIEVFFEREAKRYNLALKKPVDVSLAGELKVKPPMPPDSLPDTSTL